MPDLSDVRFTRDHEWVRINSEQMLVGITDYAQQAVGDVVFVDLPEIGTEVAAGDGVAEVESTKTVSAVMAPLSGRVVAVNDALSDRPELINEDPFGEGWMFALVVADQDGLTALMDEAAYRLYVNEVSG